MWNANMDNEKYKKMICWINKWNMKNKSWQMEHEKEQIKIENEKSGNENEKW